MRAGLEAAKWRNQKPRKTAPKHVRNERTRASFEEWMNSEQTHMTPTEKDRAQIEHTERRQASAEKWVADLVKKREAEKKTKIAESLARLSKKTTPAGKIEIK